ncbi:malate dehydrogenase MDH3 SCDLUD_002641 [Saccharomycodes ludwigii]|uniref:malate dehydrogenase MDH3 n=1 Tax=Saccharomycodes ludwigii TaxID=36035 RepID=UPI001E8B89C7|nr:hypothetical protein SCDLUD_002641 [Saccharomycodes ludwigii]KAH3901158.1 hypothetical protein SCDLUD_002641 [Saccharomycodes ludwigii]
MSEGLKVTVLGAAGGIGQPLSLLLTLSKLPIRHLSLYDIRLAPGVATDLSHITNVPKITGHVNPAEALEGTDVVVIVAGVPRKPGMTRDDLFSINAKIMQGLIKNVAIYAKPTCCVCVVSNPVNSLVAVAVETLKQYTSSTDNSGWVENRVFGVTTLDNVRAETFSNNKDVIVIGGHAGKTIIPLLPNGTEVPNYEEFVHRVQFGGDEVVKAKDGKGSATLSMSWAGFRFVSSVIKAKAGLLNGSTVSENELVPAFVNLKYNRGGKQLQNKLRSPKIEYFACPIKLQNHTGFVDYIDSSCLRGIPAREEKLIVQALPQLKREIQKGKDFVAKTDNSKL